MQSIARGSPLHTGDVGIAIRRSPRLLRFPEHGAQALHRRVVRSVQRAQSGAEQFHGLSDAARLIDAALLADRQVHGQVQEGIGPVRGLVVVSRQRGDLILQVVPILRVLTDLQAGQRFDRFHGLGLLLLALHGAEKVPDIGLRGVEHGVRCRIVSASPIIGRVQFWG